MGNGSGITGPRRTLAVALLTTLAASAFGAVPALAQDDAEEPLEIAYIQTGPFDYYQRGVEGAQMAAEQLGVNISVLNSDLSAEQEIANVEDAITKGVDGIVLFSVGRASEEAALTQAGEAGVPVAVLYGYAPSSRTWAPFSYRPTSPAPVRWPVSGSPRTSRRARWPSSRARSVAVMPRHTPRASRRRWRPTPSSRSSVNRRASGARRGPRGDAGPADRQPGPGGGIRAERGHGPRRDPGHQGRWSLDRGGVPERITRWPAGRRGR